MAYIDDVYSVVQIQPTGIEAFVRLSQNENGRRLYFAITGGEIPTGSTATLSGTKPDGVVYSKTGTITGNVVTILEDVQLTAAAGPWPARLRILNGGNVVATGRIRFVIDKDPVAAGAVPSDSQLEGLVAEAAAYAEAAKDGAYYGSPLTASTVAGMTDKNRVYVYTGSESGYTAGNWYYWNGSAWTSGGVYNSQGIQTDKTLSVTGMAADAKATGDALKEVQVETDKTLTQADVPADAKVVGDELTALKADLSALEVDYSDTSFWESGGITAAAGEDAANEKRIRTGYISRVINRVNPENGYKVAIYVYSSSGVYIGIYNGNGYHTSNLYWYTSAVNLGEIPSEYKLRVVGSKEPESSISPSDATNIFLEGYTDISLSQSGKAADAKAVGDAISAIEPGLSDEAKTALLDCFAHVAWIDEHGQDYYDALEEALDNAIQTIKLFIGKGISGTDPATIVDNPKRALTEPIPFKNVVPITVQRTVADDGYRCSIKFGVDDQIVSSSVAGTAWSPAEKENVGMQAGWIYTTNEQTLKTWYVQTAQFGEPTIFTDTTNNTIRLLFAPYYNLTDNLPENAPRGHIIVQGKKYKLEVGNNDEFV